MTIAAVMQGERAAPTTEPAPLAQRGSGELECMNANELASCMRVNRKTVYEYAARGVIPCRRLGRRLVFLRAAVVAWLAKEPGRGAPILVGR